jgi:hypothetical protein
MDQDVAGIKKLLKSVDWNHEQICGLIEVAFRSRKWVIDRCRLWDIIQNPNQFNQGVMAAGYGPGLKAASPQGELFTEAKSSSDPEPTEGENPECRAALNAGCKAAEGSEV